MTSDPSRNSVVVRCAHLQAPNRHACRRPRHMPRRPWPAPWLHYSPECLLILVRTAAAVGDQRHDREHDEGHDAYDGAEVVVVVVHGQLVQPGDEQIGLAGRIADHRRLAAGQQVDDVEVVHVAGERRDQVRGQHEDDVRHRDLREDLPPVRTVDLGGLVLVGRNVLQNAGHLHDRVRNADPQVDHDDGHTGPGRVGEERHRIADPAPVHEDAVDGALGLEHLVHDEQRHELRNGDRHREDGTPEALALRGLAVDDHG